jgi:hypothetical protein
MIVEPNPRETSRLIDAVNRHHVTIVPIVPALAFVASHDQGRRLLGALHQAFSVGLRPAL